MMICIELLVMLLKIPSNEIILEEIPKPLFHNHSTEITHRIQSLKIRETLFITPKLCSFFHRKDNPEFSFPTIPLKFKDFLNQMLFSTWEIERIDVRGERNLNLQIETRICQKQACYKVMQL